MMDSIEPNQNITIQISRSFKDIKVYSPRLKKLVKTTCSLFSNNNNKTGNTKYEISIAIVDDAKFRELNSLYLKRQFTSDCLSFDLSDNDSGSTKLFEIVVNGEIAVKQANLRGHPAEAELALYITHGLLHNLGYDDSTEKKALKMHETEDKILQQFGYGIVYNRNLAVRERKHRKKK
jgi:probable rRNA maturation factor